MPINEKFLQARAAEHRNRLLSHVRLCAPLHIPFRKKAAGTFRVPQLLLTERMRIELQLMRNAFFTGAPPLLGDVFNVLWRMHPAFARPVAERFLAVRHLDRRRLRFLRLWYAYGSFRIARVHRSLTRRVRQCDLFAASDIIRARLGEAEQDSPGYCDCGGGVSRRSAIAPEFCYYDELVDYVSTTYHLAPDAVLDLPRALIHQLYRNRVLNTPDGELKVFAPSDSLLSA